MRAVRLVLAVAGIACVAWGLWSMRDFTAEQLVSAGSWAVGAVVVHDAVLAPLAVVIGIAGARWLPRSSRRPAAVAFLVWGTLTVAFLPLLSGVGGKPGNDTILGRPYVLSWVVLTALLVAGVAAAARIRARAS